MHSLKALAARRDGEEGFTLIELMVVVLIIAILIAIAIPTFLGARSRSQDRAAQSDLRNGLTTEKTVYTDKQVYIDCTADTNPANGKPDLFDSESSLNWCGTKSPTRPLNVLKMTNSVTDDSVCLSEQSASGAWYAIGDLATSGAAQAGTYFQKGAADPCAGATPGGVAAWSPSFP